VYNSPVFLTIQKIFGLILEKSLSNEEDTAEESQKAVRKHEFRTAFLYD
jgi:hypothetical protein